MTDVRGFSPEHLRVRVVYAHVYTWQGMSIGATHWMGKLQARGCDSVVLTRQMTAEEAEALSKKDGFTTGFYAAGKETERFLSSNSVYHEARRRWLEHFPLAVLLIAGRASNADPQRILLGPPGAMERLNALTDRSETIGYWDHREHEAEMQAIAAEWDDIMDKIKRS
jgi:hypothetical protein